MTHCPVEDCKEVDEIKDILFKDAEGGIRYDIRNMITDTTAELSRKVSWAGLGSVLAIFISIISIGVGVELHSRAAICAVYDKSLEKNKTDIEAFSTKLLEVTANQKAVMSDLSWIKESLKRLEGIK